MKELLRDLDMVVAVNINDLRRVLYDTVVDEVDAALSSRVYDDIYRTMSVSLPHIHTNLIEILK